MVAVKISAGRYAKYTSEKGPAYKVVPDVWKRIWETPPSTPAGHRAYKTDFELYDQRAVDPEKSQVDVYVGIKLKVRLFLLGIRKWSTFPASYGKSL